MSAMMGRPWRAQALRQMSMCRPLLRHQCNLVTASSSSSSSRAERHASRRELLSAAAAGAAGLAALTAAAAPPALPAATGAARGSGAAERCLAQLSQLSLGDCFAQQGPLLPLELPRLEHTCTSCFPACSGNQCMLSINVTYAKGGGLLGMAPPYPLCLMVGGFTVGAAAYRSSANRLASWGYTVLRLDTRDTLYDVLDDVTCVKLLRELIDWAAGDPLMRQLADSTRVYMAGHSRGGKLAALTAAADARVAALCLLDPVDVTKYAPLSARFPSAAAALASVAQSGRFLPVAIVGCGGASRECAPPGNDAAAFFAASPSAAWLVSLPGAGHFQVLDRPSALQQSLCGRDPDGPADDDVRRASQSTLVAWGETLMKPPGRDVLSTLTARCGGGSGASVLWAPEHWSVSSSAAAWQPPLSDAPPLSALKHALAAENAAAAGGPRQWLAMQQPLPQVQTRQEQWAGAPSPAQLRMVQSVLQHTMVAVANASSNAMQVNSSFKNLG